MKKRRSGKSTASLAGWLFADLALVLFIVSLSSSESNAACPKPRKGRELPEWCTPSSTLRSTTTTSTTSTTTTTEPDPTGPDGPGGIKPEPVEIVLESWKSDSLAQAIETELRDAYMEDPALRSVGAFDDIRFGVIIVYGGSKGRSSTSGDRVADRAEKLLTDAWNRVEPITYFETGHDQGLVAGGLNLKLFPILGKSG